jgi:CHAT domain
MADFVLDVDTNAAQRAATLRLSDGQGRHRASHEVRLADHPASTWEGVFDTRRYVRRHAGNIVLAGSSRPATAAELLESVGVFLGATVLGPAIFKLLSGVAQRTLLVRLGGGEGDALGAAFARTPWEIARAAKGTVLLGRNVSVRALPAGAAVASDDEGPESLEEGEPLRVLLVFAETPGSRPLAMRLERERLVSLFYDEVLAERQVELDVLCHGVTRRSLKEAVTRRAGYHVVHWSGHGQHDRLELWGDGRPDPLTGAGLVDLFAEAGGFVPKLVFLSACLSGTMMAAPDRATRRAMLEGREDEASGGPSRSAAADVGQVLGAGPGHTGTALALQRAGVQQVVAMRYEVGDDYARELAKLFYRRLLVDEAGHPADQALSLARGELASEAGRYDPVDHVTPLVFGAERLRLVAPRGRGAQLDRRWPRPQPLLRGGSRDLDASPPEGFVGRGRELTRLQGEWLESKGAAARGVALVQGLAGLGKTSLASEAIHLWHGRFEVVLAFQARGDGLGLEHFYQHIDKAMVLEVPGYAEQCRRNPNARIYLEPRADLTGEARHERLRQNLLQSLRDHRVLLVFDNFETMLRTQAESDGHSYRSLDPAWDTLLTLLVSRLPETRSRLLVTGRHRPAVLVAKGVLWLPLGALEQAEAVLFLRGHEPLRALLAGSESERLLAERVLDVSRGHPLILSRLAALAADTGALGQALDRLQAKGYGELPDLFSAGKSDDERAYLEDVAVRAVDLLIERVSSPARRILAIVTLATEPVMLALAKALWAPEADGLDAAPLLHRLHEVGLLSATGEGDAVVYAFHELVRERSAAWSRDHGEDRPRRTNLELWEAYGGVYKSVFRSLALSNEAMALEMGRRAVAYLAKARSFEQLGQLASVLVTSSSDPDFLRPIIADLEAIGDHAPLGKARWRLWTALADALVNSGQTPRSLLHFEEAAAQALAAEAWDDLGAIYNNWAFALTDLSEFDAAHRTFLLSADTGRRADAPEVNVLNSELGALRIDVLRGRVETALPEIEARLTRIRGFWLQYRTGQPVPEAPIAAELARALISALDVAEDANRALKRWQACVDLLTEIEEVERVLGRSPHDLAITKFNRYGPLLRLNDLPPTSWTG